MEYQGEPGFAGLSICDSYSATLRLYNASGSAKYTETILNEAPSTFTANSADVYSDGMPRDVAVCAGVRMKTVDLRCSMDGCTVQPDVDGTVKSCKDYCGSNGLKCVEAWVSKEEDCGFDTVSACDAFLEDPEAMQVCRCER